MPHLIRKPSLRLPMEGIERHTTWRVLSKVPLDPVYIPERFGAFTIIILGQTIAAVVFGLESGHWQPSSVIASILAFILAIIIWGRYYYFTKIADYQCTLGSGQPYVYSHIPLIGSLIIIGVCAQDFISAPEAVSEQVKIIFGCAVIVWLTSLYLLQYIAVPNLKRQRLVYVGGISAVAVLFLFNDLSPVWIMLGLVLIFACLFALQCWIGGEKHLHHKK